VGDRKKRRRPKKLIDARSILADRYRLNLTVQSASISLLSRFKGEYYRCPHCKFMMPKKEAKISGFNAEHSVRYVRCLRCGRKITGFTEVSPLKDMLKGAGYIAAGGALAYLLYPLLNIYALQLGFFLSLYGTLKILIRPSK